MRKTKPQYFFHVTQSRWRFQKLLKPRDPAGRPCNEPATPRICVAPTIAGCISAIYEICDHDHKFYVYRTLDHVKACYTRGVKDAFITGEKWLLEPIWFVRICSVDLSSMFAGIELNGCIPGGYVPCGGGTKRDNNLQRDIMKNAIRPTLRERSAWFSMWA